MATHRDTNPEHWHGVPVNAIANGATAALNNHAAILVDTSGGASTFQLPVPTSAAKRMYLFYDPNGSWSTNSFTLSRANGGNIDGVASNKSFTDAYGAVVVMCDGANFFTRRIGVMQDDSQNILSAQVFA